MRYAFLLLFTIGLLASGVFAQTPTPTADLASLDHNKDGIIDGRDVLLFLRRWGERDVYTPNWTATVTPSSSNTLSPTPTPSLTDSPTKTATQTLSQTLTPTRSATTTPTRTETRTHTSIITDTATVTQTATITQTPTPTGLAHFREGIEEEFKNSTTFDLDREVARVMLDPRVPDLTKPQWKRETYQSVIDAARNARLSHGNPYIGEIVNLPLSRTEFISVSHPISGKTPLKITYYSGIPDNNVVWGENEDIVYLTGLVAILHPSQTLTIKPNTIVLMSSFYDDVRNGALSIEQIRELREKYVEWPGPIDWSNPLGIQYFMQNQESFYATRKPFLHIQDGAVLLARGKETEPILICSDAAIGKASPEDWKNVSPYDWSTLSFCDGIIDYSMVFDCQHASSLTNHTITARSVFNNHLESGRNGPGWIIGCSFGKANNEGIDVHLLDGSFHIVHNLFENTWNTGIMVAQGNIIDIRNNTFSGLEGRDIGTFYELASDHTLFVNRNNFLLPSQISNKWAMFSNGTSFLVDAMNNYWGTTEEAIISQEIYDRHDDSSLGLVSYVPFLTSPDTDRDGLTDEEEATQGTDPNVMDSDGDFCIDGLEVNQYQTLPLNPDTDGDGIPDGIEVFRGTDPKVK